MRPITGQTFADEAMAEQDALMPRPGQEPDVSLPSYHENPLEVL